MEEKPVPWSYTNRMWEDSMQEVLVMMRGLTGPAVELVRVEATEKLAAFQSWREIAPTDAERQKRVAEVTALYRHAKALRELADSARASDPRASDPADAR